MDIEAADAPKKLTDIVSEMILLRVGGAKLGDALVRAYRRTFVPDFAE